MPKTKFLTVMGIDSLWPRILKAEGDEFIVDNVDVNTVFVDAQVMLMKSKVPEWMTTWKQFAQFNFERHVTTLHRKFSTVILSFDNYEKVPEYKGIEQSLRSQKSKSCFKYEMGDDIPRGPPKQDIWVQALQNRFYKTTVISIISRIIASNYKPEVRPRTLVIDYVNVVRIDFLHFDVKRQVMQEMNELGESDVKFLRYTSLFGDILVESIDSDCILISMLHVQRHNFEVKVYIKRYKSTSIDGEDEGGNETTKKRKRDGKRKALEYEILDVCALLAMMQTAVIQAIGPEIHIQRMHMTKLLVAQMLLTGTYCSNNNLAFCSEPLLMQPVMR